MLKNDTLKNGTSRIGLYGSAPPGISFAFLHLASFVNCVQVKIYLNRTVYTRRTGKRITIHAYLLRTYMSKNFFFEAYQNKNFAG